MVPRKGHETSEEVVPQTLASDEDTRDNSQMCLWLVHNHLKSSGLDKLAEKLLKKTQLDPTRFDDNGENINLGTLMKQFGPVQADTSEKKSDKKRKRIDSSSSSSSSSDDSSSEDEDEEPAKKLKVEPDLALPAAPKNNKPCFKCNQPGHFAKDCTNEVTCYKCKKVGHLSKDCPKDKEGQDEYYDDGGDYEGGGGSQSQQLVCHHCQQPGHTRRNCPQADEKKVKGNPAANMTCYHCNETGHLSRDCEVDGGVPCYNCGQQGHLSRDCTVSKSMLCYNCKQPGHLSKDCKDPNGETSKMQCYKCQEYGHMARSCTNAKRERQRGGEGRPARSATGRRAGKRDNGGFQVVPRNFGSGANTMPLGGKSSGDE